MQNQANIKRSPIVTIRSFLFIEIAGLLLFLLATQFDALKYQLYSFFFFSKFFSYETTKFLFLSIAQFVITVYAFMRWYYESYSVRPGLLSHQWGVLFRKNKNIPLDKSMAVTVSAGPLAKLFHYGSIYVEDRKNKNNAAIIADISRPRDFLKVLERCLNSDGSHFHTEPNLKELLQMEEHERLEFKTSFRFDHKIDQLNRELEKAALKTIAAFLNTKGGHLVIGVNDEKEPIGLARDYATLKRQDNDGFENHFTQIFNVMIGPEFRHFVKVWFNSLSDIEICVVQVVPSTRPVYLKTDGNEYFFVRTGNVTTPLKLSEVEVYRRSRWPNRVSSGI